jgi:hypothetical protein
MYLNYQTGLSKYSGLLEMAEGYGVLEKQGHRHVLDGEILGFYKDWRENSDVWDKILPKLEERLKKELKFKNSSDISSLEKLDDEVSE